METNLKLHSSWSWMNECVCGQREMEWREAVMAHTQTKKVGGAKKQKSVCVCVCAFPAPYREGLAHEAATIKVISTFKVQY